NGHVWVIDTGVDAAHPDLNVVEFKNFAGGPNKDCNGHGTHVAGTVAAEDDASHVVGVAPGASIHAIKVLGCSGSGSNSGVIAGIDWVTEHALPGAVANMSLGGGASQAIDEAVRASADAGVLYVLAAGNANVDACTTSPARAGAGTNNGIVTVGALSAPGTRASFSNFGSCVDIWAPGVNVLSTWPGATTRARSGTSMAAPHVAGGGALLRSVSIGSGLSVSEAEEQLKDDAVAGTFPLLDVSGY
ncbi:MAG: S8 family peptidase, partial [Acidimicrobiia bacterium]